MSGTKTAVREEFRVDGLPEPISHYTDAVRFGDTLYISGVPPLDEAGKVVKGDAAAQTEQIFKNMKKMLAAVGADFSDVLKVTVYMTNVKDRTSINPVRQKYFGGAKLASTLIGVKELAIPGMMVEIDAVVGLPAVEKAN
jgi:2-iminobutanoate/2-iminopropanoate deaminase